MWTSRDLGKSCLSDSSNAWSEASPPSVIWASGSRCNSSRDPSVISRLQYEGVADTQVTRCSFMSVISSLAELPDSGSTRASRFTRQCMKT